MTVVHTVPSISNEASGPSYSVRRLCESLLDQGQNVTLATLSPMTGQSELPYLKLFARGIGPARLGRSPQMKHWLDAEARCDRIALFHNHSLWMMPNVYPGAIARKYDLPLVVAPRGTFTRYAFASGSRVKRLFWPLVQRPALRGVSAFHATAEAEYGDIRNMGFRQPVAIIPNGVDVPNQLRPPRSSSRTLLYVGRLHPEKGLEMLLKAWGAVSPGFADWSLQLVGPDIAGFEGQLRRLALQLGLNRVHFAGPMYGSEKRNAYLRADLFVLPSLSENFGMAIAEALAAGTPVISTKGTPWRRLESEGAGWWADTSVDGLVDVLRAAMDESPAALMRRGERGRAWMIREFSWMTVAERMRHYYGWLIGGGTVPPFVVLD